MLHINRHRLVILPKGKRVCLARHTHNHALECLWWGTLRKPLMLRIDGRRWLDMDHKGWMAHHLHHNYYLLIDDENTIRGQSSMTLYE